MTLPLATTTWDDREIAAIQSVVDSGRYTMGEQVFAFERAFADWMGARHCVMVNSGSSANLLMLDALRFHSRWKLQPDAEVIVPAVSWSTTYYPVTQAGFRLKFVDIDAETLNYDLTALASAISPRTRAIVAVNLLGNPNDFAAINSLIGARDIVLLEDNCESMGATFEGRQAGTFGLAGSYSSFFSHHISTMEGGLIVTNDDEFHQILLATRAHGWTRQLPKQNLVCGERSDNPFYEAFRFVLPGYNVRPLEMSGAIGLCQLEKLQSLVDARRQNAASFGALFRDHPHVAIQRETGKSSWFGFALIVRPGAPFSRDQLVAALAKDAVECRPIVAGNFTRNEVIEHLPHDIHGSLPNADRVHDHGLFIGNHHFDIRPALDQVAATVDRLSAR